MNLKLISVIIVLIIICLTLRQLRRIQQNFKDINLELKILSDVEKQIFLNNFYKYNNYPRILENEIQVKRFPNSRRIVIQDLTRLTKIPVFKFQKNLSLNQNRV